MRPAHLIFHIASLGLVATLAGGAAASEARVTGLATYPDRAMLPPGTVLEVALQDVSRADAPAEVIATDIQEDLGPPPYPFVLEYDPDEISSRNTYSVRARVTLGDRLLMTTDTHAPVITWDAPTEVDVILHRVSSPPGSAGQRQLHTAPGLKLPASFTGTTPMASGPGMEWHLDLWPDQVYHLRQTYGDGEPNYDRGRWSADPARGAIVLRGGREAPVPLEILGNGDLRLMDLEGRPIESDLPYTLTAGPLEPAEGTQFLTGEFRYMADAATFTECLTGRTYPVAMEGAYIGAERAYTSLEGIEPGAPVLALLEGRLATRAQMDGPERMHLVIERFDRFDSERSCATTGGYTGRQGEAELTNTYWRLLDLADADGTHSTRAQIPVTFPQDLLFESDSASLSPDLQGQLTPLAEDLLRDADSEVLVVGHADDSGGAARNQVLSEQRAASVAHALVAEGGPSHRIRTVGRAATEPVAASDAPDGRARNRRVEIFMITGEAAEPVEQRREPYLILLSEDGAFFNATVGCNMIRGGYETEGDRLSFGAAAMTRMACLPPLDAMEQALVQALSLVARWQIDGTVLELFDKDDNTV
ncbi:YbaY family lipoprotein, partial [Roseovarius sp.]|uniref:YbaY family lipoprotein n=1 Tax=Roseovarius sp. TaxID=1486281 RepID=UPI003569C9E5